MAKPKRRYVCQSCGSVSPRWQGQCADCGEWNTLVEEAPETVFSAKHDLSSGGRLVSFVSLDQPVKLPERRKTGLAEFDRALGGGLVPGSAILMGGDPGSASPRCCCRRPHASRWRARRRSISAARKRPTRCACAPTGSDWAMRRSGSRPIPRCATS
jgi:hypothetical protein